MNRLRLHQTKVKYTRFDKQQKRSQRIAIIHPTKLFEFRALLLNRGSDDNSEA